MADTRTSSFEELLQFLYLSPIGIVKFRADGAIDLINPIASALLLSIAPVETLQNIYAALAPLAPDLHQLVAQFAGPAGIIVEERWVPANAGGQAKMMSLTVHQIKVDVYMAVMTDVTRLVQQEHRISADQKKFAAISNHARDYAIYTITNDGVVEEWNHSIESYAGWLATDLQGKSMSLLFPKDDPDRPCLDLLLAEARRVGSVETEGWRLKRDGSRLWANSVITALPDEVGQLRGFVVVSRDITGRKEAEKKLKFINLLLESEMEASPDGIVVIGPDRKIILFNRRFSEIWKVPPALLTGGTMDTALLLAKPLMQEPVEFIAAVDRLFRHPGEDTQAEYVLTDGRIIDSHVVTLLGASGDYLGRVWYFRDVTERRKADDEIAFVNIVLRTQMEASLDGMIVVNEKNAIVAYNQRFATIWEIPPADLAAGDDASVLPKVASLIKGKQKFIDRVRYLYDHPGEDSQDELETTDGRSIDCYTVTLYSPSRTYLGRAWFFRDITERKRVEALALRMARYDVLTGLANRAVFVEALQHAIAGAKRGEKSFAVLYLDLDHFKDVNDTLGHPVGDELLKAVADRLRSSARETDTVARFGGDEFAIIEADIHDPADAAILAGKLIKSFVTPFLIQGSDIHSGASIGIATYGSEASDAETLLSHADVALYRAKSEGRGDYRFFTDAMDLEVQTRVTLGTELRMALDENQLFLLYQPQVAIDGGRITGMEALVRWQHPRRGALNPSLFIPIAEQIGIIAKLGHWVLWEACRQGKAWLDAGIAPGRVAVNVSALQFRTPVALEADIAAALAQTGLPPQMLELELTESVLMDASREHSDLLQRLHKIGVTIAIDDFGTGYSSLDYLRRFPSNRIKIAQNFVTDLQATSSNAAIIRATIGLAHELKIDVIAEGVETQEQCDLLKDWGCHEVQGYLFAKPLTAKDAGVALRNGKVSASEVGTVKVGKSGRSGEAVSSAGI